MKATGQCLCGAVKFTAEDVQTEIHACHCGICRKWTGGPAFAASVGRVTFDDDKSITRYDSSAWGERGSCHRCGTNLFFRLKEANHYMLLMGIFDDQTQFKLAGEIYIDEKPDVYSLAGNQPRLTGEQFIASLENKDSG